MKIKQEVLIVLSTMECTGKAAKITSGQLDRKLYLEVNKVLEALGGKWSRAGKVHVFDGDASELLDTAIVTGEVTTAREIGFFETPVELATELCAMAGVQVGDVCLEPSAGTGRIVEALAKYRPRAIIAVEVDPERCARFNSDVFSALRQRHPELTLLSVHADFMTRDLSLTCDVGPVDRVVMNPPFTKVGVGGPLDHVYHAFKMLKSGGVLVSVLPSGVVFRQDRQHRTFRAWVEQEHGTIAPLPDDSFEESGTGVRTCVLKIVKGA
jgi:predicted RNA methylase